MKLKKKILAGILSGAILMTSGLAFNDAQAAQNQEHWRGYGNHMNFERNSGHRMGFGRGMNFNDDFQFSDEQIAEFAKKIADYYGIDQYEVETALRENTHFGDIRHAATLAKLSGRSFSEVLAMKNDWHQVADKLGVTREQFDAFMKEEMLGWLAKRSRLDTKTVQNLLDDGYNPRDICMAGIIAGESGKGVKSVLNKRKINNSWQDVAKEFNVDAKKLFGGNRQHKNSQRN